MGSWAWRKWMEQKIKQDEIFIGKNIRRIRKERGRTFAKEI